MDTIVALAVTDQEILDCYDVMAGLRPHIGRADFVSRVRRQHEDSGYQLAYLRAGDVKAVGGFRIGASSFTLTTWSPRALTDPRATAGFYLIG